MGLAALPRRVFFVVASAAGKSYRAESDIPKAGKTRLGDALEKLARLHLQCAGDLADIGEANVLATALNAPQVGRMKSSQFRQLFLRELPPFA